MLKYGPASALAALVIMAFGGWLHVHSQSQRIGIEFQQKTQGPPYTQVNSDSGVTALDNNKSDNDEDAGSEQGAESASVFGVRFRITDGAIVILTLVLVIISAVQARRLRQTVSSFMQGERANIYIGDPDVSQLWPAQAVMYPGASGIPKSAVGIMLINYGRTAAFVVDLRMQLDFVDKIPHVPTYTHATRAKGFGVLHKESESNWYRCESMHPITASDIVAKNAGTKEWILFGFVRYMDVFDQLWERGFSIRFGPPDPGFHPLNLDTYNYVMRLKPTAFWKRLFHRS